MFFDRDIRLHVYPEKYQNDVHDIANLFYRGAIYRGGSRPPRDTDGVRNANGVAAAFTDVISVTESARGYTLDVTFYGTDGPCANITSEIYSTGDIPSYNIKMALYRLLKTRAAALHGAENLLPWGALVGVRPVKTYAELAGSGADRTEIIDRMARAYDVSADMSDLCLRIAGTQREILSRYDNAKDFMLYIGIPFCVSKCAYCSFPSDAHNRADVYAPRYIDALTREMRFTAGLMKGSGRRLKAVYIGGGTPTAIGARELRRLIYNVADAFPDDCPDEYTVEAGRADTLDREKLGIIRSAARCAGRLRLCINPQSMNRATLDLIGRSHTPEDVERAFLLARDAGLDDINMDIIAGLPGEGLAEFENTLEAVGRLGPESLTSHTLCIKRSSRLNERPDKYGCPEAHTAASMQAAAFRYADTHGMRPYYLYRQKNTVGNLANVGFAVEGRYCVYNIHEMADCIDVLAIGAGAVSKFTNTGTGRIDRVFNVKNLLEYINRNDEMIGRKAGFITQAPIAGTGPYDEGRRSFVAK